MASVEFIKKRIEGRRAEIERLNKKKERILKAAEYNYESHNPYYYTERDLKKVIRDIELAERSLAEYEDSLLLEEKKAGSRNVPAITEFLDAWEVRTVEFFLDAYVDYKEARQKLREEEDAEDEAMRNTSDASERKQMWNAQRYKHRQFDAQWAFVTQFFGHGSYEAAVRKEIAAEKARKYDFIIERVTNIVGTITDATGLSVGRSGELNGFIVGTDGSAKVETIGAGGYNIQRYHFRTLIHAVK